VAVAFFSPFLRRHRRVLLTDGSRHSPTPPSRIHHLQFVKTPLYVQIYGFFDGTKINIPYGDDGGELDPHGAENLGNPVGGNVTSNITGQDVFYEEWMSFMSYNQYCLRICTAEDANYTAALMCEQ
jgi:hypothetical protein